MAGPKQLELPGLDQDQSDPGNLELSHNDLILLLKLATTGRDLLRRHLLADKVPTANVYDIKSTVTRADVLLDKLVDHLKNEPKPRVN